MNLRDKTISGARWTTASAVISSAIGLLQLTILTHLLTKIDFGLFATVTVVLGLASFVVEAGMGSAVIHQQKSSSTQLGTAWLINLLLGWTSAGCVYALGPAIASFYNNQQLAPLVSLGALLFVTQPPGMQYGALLQRDLCFKQLAIIEITAQSVGFLIIVGLVLSEFGAKSLVLGQLSIASFRSVCFLWYGVPRYGFHLTFSLRESAYFVRFGIFQIGENIVNYLNTQIDVVIVGKFLGQEDLGIYYIAKQLVSRPIGLINPIVTKVALPVFARLQTEGDVLKSKYLGLVGLLSTVHALVFFSLAIWSREIAGMLFGAKWAGSALLVSILAMYAFLRAVGNPIGSLQLALGRVELGFYFNLALLFCMTPILFAGSWLGLAGVAWSLAFGGILLELPTWYFLIRPLSGLSAREYFTVVIGPVAKGIVCFAFLFVIDSFLGKLIGYLVAMVLYLRLSTPTLMILALRRERPH